MSECKCTMAQSITGDGCRYCQPQEYIDRLHEQINDTEIERDTYERSFQFLLSESEMWKHLRADVLALCEAAQTDDGVRFMLGGNLCRAVDRISERLRGSE